MFSCLALAAGNDQCQGRIGTGAQTSRSYAAPIRATPRIRHYEPPRIYLVYELPLVYEPHTSRIRASSALQWALFSLGAWACKPDEAVASVSCCSSSIALCSASPPFSSGIGEPDGPGCTCVLRVYLAVTLESVGVEEESHALNIGFIAQNVSPKDTQDTNVHSTR